ncbi:MAG: bifunctional diguanylate cyclase/phosphodiesterase [Tessaracoccus sp.]|uniref:putative bifunctional diguanylate cyclase/phosphodiesterase n=1 Tax=Tessaracoccus sp. TaxID=1971211 RepID=UPI001EC8B44C|nr:bifunctional diguanylate cyclase/phosphodiesterase [Tessaracoccus sp.]MBK7821981.1 bifunctional diguanylate cyclase/phosphodiesterase [Tessaracoccus sp.]
MMNPRPVLELLARTPAVPRRLSDRAVFIWGTIWTVLVASLLGYFWITASPVRDPLWMLVVFVSTLASSALTVTISRIDATMVVSPAPAMLLIALNTVPPTEALAVWMSAYFLGSLARFRHLGDASETTSYLFGCAFVAMVVKGLLDAAGVPWPITVVVFVAAYLLTRLMISTIRLSVVVELSRRKAFGELLLRRLVMAWVAISVASIVGLSVQDLIAVHSGSMGPFWAGGLASFLIGIAAFAGGVFRESRTVSAQLSGTLAAALELPWAHNVSVESHALQFARRALPRYTVALQDRDERNVNEIVSPLTEGYLVARRGTTQSPFLVQDQRVLDAIAHIAVTMSAAQRERELLSSAAVTDALTGLPNYHGFREALATTVGEDGFAVVYVDVDGFKAINDHHGHETGNAVLRTIAMRMRLLLSTADVVARVGGDEFVLILAGVANEEEAQLRVELLLHEVSAPFVAGDTVIPLWLSHGLAYAPPGTTDIGSLVEAADARMYAARGRHVPGSSPQSEIRPSGAVNLVETIATAIRERKLTFVYQPIVNGATNQIVSFEALVRPHESKLEGITADLIVHEARRLGLLTELSTHVIDTAVRDMCRFQQIAPELLDVHVNINVEQVTDPAFLEAMSRVEGCNGVHLTLELSETSLNRASEETIQELERLRAQENVRIALDDFGRDSSTLLSLLQFPLDVLKIDKALSRGMDSPKPRMVMRSMAMLARNLDVEMVVEGVEDDETLDELIRSGVRYMQGYRFGAPLSADAMVERLTHHGLRARLP